MKKLLFLFGFAVLFSCSDDFKVDDQPAGRAPSPPDTEFPVFTPCKDMTFEDPNEYNRKCIQNQIDAAHVSGANGLIINDLDCYVNTTFTNLIIPSDFTLILGKGTTLRSFSNDFHGRGLIDIGIKDEVVKNVKIIGGHLIGNRLSDPTPTIDGLGHVIRVKDCHDVTIENVWIEKAAADGIYFSGFYNINQIGNYVETYNILVKNCVIDSSRRANISITDGHDIEITGCKILNGGISFTESPGAAPYMGINIEGTRTSNGTELTWTKHPHDINIHDNLESGTANNISTLSQRLAIGVTVGDHVIISNNTVGATISYAFGDHIQIVDNTITNASLGIAAGKDVETIFIHDNEITGNKIMGCKIGLDLHNEYTTIAGNVFQDFNAYGIQFKKVKNIVIKDNGFSSSAGDGIKAVNGNNYADKLTISGNKFDLNSNTNIQHGIYLQSINALSAYENYVININNNAIFCSGQVALNGVTGVNFFENTVITGVGMFITSGNKLDMYNNSIRSNGNANTLTLQECHLNSYKIHDNSFWSNSSDIDDRCIYADKIENVSITRNTLRHNASACFRISNITNCVVSDNIGDIGSCLTSPLFIIASNAVNTTFSSNNAVQAPLVRQSINTVVQAGPCP